MDLTVPLWLWYGFWTTVFWIAVFVAIALVQRARKNK